MAKWDLPASLSAKKDEVIDHIRRYHLKNINDSDGPVFYISDRYAGVWLEQCYDAVHWSRYIGDPSVAKNQLSLFIKHQLPDGQMPMAVHDARAYYGQIQECVSFGKLCLETYEMCGDRDFLATAYDALVRWDAWLVKYRMTTGRGLIEMFCGYDTGHDNSGRLSGMKYHGKVDEQLCDAKLLPVGCKAAPILAPDMNAVFYGDRVALSKMADILGKPDESAQWAEKAEEIRRRLIDVCFDKRDGFFYDVDKNNNFRRCRTVAVTNVLCEDVADDAMLHGIFDRYLWNENEFKTPYPFPAVSIADPTWHKNLAGNSWGYYSQAQTVLRATRWMPRYGLREELRQVMYIWLKVWEKEEKVLFGQELDPLTGVPSNASPWYSSAMLLFLYSLEELEADNRGENSRLF